MGTLLEVKNWGEFTSIKASVVDDLRAVTYTHESLVTVSTHTIGLILEVVRYLDSYVLLLEEMGRATEVDLRGLRALCREHGVNPAQAETYASLYAGQAPAS